MMSKDCFLRVEDYAVIKEKEKETRCLHSAEHATNVTSPYNYETQVYPVTGVAQTNCIKLIFLPRHLRTNFKKYFSSSRLLLFSRDDGKIVLRTNGNVSASALVRNVRRSSTQSCSIYFHVGFISAEKRCQVPLLFKSRTDGD